MKKTYKSLLTGLLVGLLAGPQWGYAAASGNYTDMLPVGAAGNTTVISNGSGWSLATIPPTQTFGDALSRVVDTVYQSTGAANINATTTVSTFSALSQGNVGSATIPAAWFTTGRTIEIIANGKYFTTNTATNWTWQVNVGTTTILNTGAIAATLNQTNNYFTAKAYLTVAATGASGSLIGTYDIFYASGSSLPGTVLSMSTTTAGAVSCDLSQAWPISPTFQWSVAGASMTINNVLIKIAS